MSLLAVVTVALLAVVGAQKEKCPSPYITIGKECYWVSDAALPWREARDSCLNSLDGHMTDLAIVDDCEQLHHLWNFIIYTLKQPEDYWLGGSDVLHEGEWKWLNGRKMVMGAPFWYPGEPSSKESEHYLALSKEGLYSDDKEEIVHKYVCQVVHLRTN